MATTKKQKTWTAETAAGVVLALLQWVVSMNAPLRVAIWVTIAGLCFDIIRRQTEWSTSLKWICWTLVAVIVPVVAWDSWPRPEKISQPVTILVVDQQTFERLTKTGSEKEVREILEAQKVSPQSVTPQAVAPVPPPSPVAADVKQSLESKLRLFEFYPKYEWPLSGDTSLEPVGLVGTTLKAKYVEGRDDYRFTPLIQNDNDGIPLLEPRITIRFPLAVQVKPTMLWAPNIKEKYRDFHAEGFGPVVPGERRGINESLFLKFPQPGIYQVIYIVSGIAQGIAVRIQGSFRFEVQ